MTRVAVPAPAAGAGSHVDALAAAFCSRTLPKAEWTHHAHLRVGLWHVLRYSPEEALDRLRAGIRALNESHGVANSDAGGYHETITRFYVWRIAAFVASTVRGRHIDDLADELIRLHGAKALPFDYWSRERLLSPEARSGWVPPDLQQPG